jgi:hypothetical protein
MGTPARNYSWTPFEPGHEISLRHGAYSKRKVDPLAGELVAGLLEDRPDLAGFPETVWAWGRAEARCLLLAEYHAEHGLFDEKGNVRGGQYVGQFEKMAAHLRATIGLDPRSEAELAKVRADATHATFDLDALRAKGREVIEAHEARRDVPAELEGDSELAPDDGGEP